MQDQPTQCQAYTTKGVALARGGTRYNRCKRNATTTREHTRVSLAWKSTTTVCLCGVHAAMLDKGMSGIMDSASR
jgi:hypothetical protein